MWLSLIALALAGTPVVVDSADPSVGAAAIAQTTGRTGLPAEQLELRSLDALLAGPPRVLGAGALRHCAASPTRASELRATVVRAEAAWRAGKVGEAVDQLDLGISGLGCLSDRVEPAVAARLFQLRGGLLAHQGEAELARAELHSALSFIPDLSWEPWMPPEGEPLFAEIKAQSGTSRLTPLPAGSVSAPWVDGRPISGPTELRPGLHLLQIPSTAGLRSSWLTVQGEARLVVPGSWRRPILERLSDPGARPELAALMQAAFGEQPAYVAHGGALYLLTFEDGRAEWEALIAPPAPAEDKEGGRRRR